MVNLIGVSEQIRWDDEKYQNFYFIFYFNFTIRFSYTVIIRSFYWICVVNTFRRSSIVVDTFKFFRYSFCKC